MHINTIVISVHTNTESYTYTHEMKVQRRNGKTPILYYVSSGMADNIGVAKLGNTTRLSCLECEVSLWCPPPNTKPRPKWGSFHSYVELLFDVYKCMHAYDSVFVCTLITIVFVCMIINCCFGVVIYINMCIAHAEISFYFTPGNHF